MEYQSYCCKICAYLLKDDQKQNQFVLCKVLQEQAKKERDFHSKFSAGDESWVYGYDPGTKQQSSHWKSHPPAIQESWGKWSQTSRACCLFSWTVRQFFRRSFFLQCQPVNQQFCIGVLRVFMEAVGRTCPTSGVCRTGFCIMTTCHATLIHGFFQCLTKKRWWCYLAFVLFHPSLHGLFWFSKIETWLEGWRFKDIMKTNLNHRQPWSTLQNRIFRGVSSCGRDIG